MLKRKLQMLVKDAVFGRWFPSVYARATKASVVPGKVLFVEQKVTPMPNAYPLLFERLQADGRFHPEYVTLQQNNVSFVQYLKNCVALLKSAATAQAIFLNDASNVLSCVSLRPETTMVQLWHGCGAFKKWGMSVADLKFGSFREDIKAHPYYANLSLVTISSPEVAWAYCEAMNLIDAPDIVQATGVSRTDVFFDPAFLHSARKRVEQALPLVAGKRIVLYAPTFRGKAGSAKAPQALDYEAVGKALADQGAVLLVKHHPYVRERPVVPPVVSDIVFDVTDQLPIDGLLCVADVLVTDYSSVIFEYSLFERPMVFFAFDKKEYDDWRGFYYDYESLTPGSVVATTQEVIDALAAARDSFDPAQVRAFREKFMGSCDGHATDRICEKVFGENLRTKED